MKDFFGFFDFLLDFLKYAVVFLVVMVVIALIFLFVIKTDYEMDKRECYEIYATDNVVLKKCEKYFERGKE